MLKATSFFLLSGLFEGWIKKKSPVQELFNARLQSPISAHLSIHGLDFSWSKNCKSQGCFFQFHAQPQAETCVFFPFLQHADPPSPVPNLNKIFTKKGWINTCKKNIYIYSLPCGLCLSGSKKWHIFPEFCLEWMSLSISRGHWAIPDWDQWTGWEPPTCSLRDFTKHWTEDNLSLLLLGSFKRSKLTGHNSANSTNSSILMASLMFLNRKWNTIAKIGCQWRRFFMFFFKALRLRTVSAHVCWEWQLEQCGNPVTAWKNKCWKNWVTCEFHANPGRMCL